MAAFMHASGATMTSDQFRRLCHVLAGTTIRELEHFRDEPRAYLAWPAVQAVVRERTQAHRRAS